MHWNAAHRGLLGLLVAIALAAGGPAVAVGGGSNGQTARVTAQAIQQTGRCIPGSRACPIRITFSRGSFDGQTHSWLTGMRSQKWFVVHARAGQAMIVIVESRGSTRGIVSFPNGGTSGQPGGRVFDDVVPATGDYRIRVTESPMGQAWSGRIDVIVVIY